MYLGFSVPSILSIYNGAGVHQWNVQVKHFFSLLYVCFLKPLPARNDGIDVYNSI